MDFNWTDAQQALRRRIIDFANAELDEGALQRDASETFSHALWRKCGEAGLLGLNAPAAFGGEGEGALSTVIALEALGYACHDNGLTFGISALLTSVLPTLIDFASDAQKARVLPALVRGDSIACYAMTEEATGSDAYALRTTATQKGDSYMLNGEKWFITFAPVADVGLIYATTNPKAGKWGLSLFLVDMKTPGLEVSPVQSKMGLRTVPMGKLILHDCAVPANCLIGKAGAGASLFNHSQEWERACILAGQIGMMERQLEACVAFARDRQAFGQSIGKFQAISNRIAEMKLRLETARLLTYRAAWLKDQGKPAMLDAALANLHLGESFLQNSLEAVRIHGARGYLTEFEVERDLRDAMGGPIYGGTSDIQRNIIARLMGL